MKSENQIKQLARDIRIKPDAVVDKRILTYAEAILAKSTKNQNVVLLRHPSIGIEIIKSPITKLAAAAMIAIAIVLLVAILNCTATPAWAIEQTIEAIEGFHAIYGSGVTVDENGNEFEFEYWARPRKDGTASGDLRMEAKGGRVIVVNEQKNITYKYDPARNVVSVESGITFYSSPWINGEYFRTMKEDCTEWHEEYRKDELTGRDCVFVKASDRDPGNNWSYIFQFDLETKLPIRGKVWNNSDFRGKPYVTANEVVYNPVLPEGIFDFKIPEGVKVIKH
jgi:outer membrane lipoprotein-sorting protein